MKLSRLEIYGFKSFAKKLDLSLTGGTTAVVGPNGCGKTNVVDAIRWVLGEQRPTLIRLERMEDVIFKGSTNRKPLGMAEVSLTIENESGRLPLAMPEVTVTRRLFRSGESEYLINKKICRLADISDMFMDTGMGTDSYSLFELGMINSILSDKTEDRRHIFEEAAGVTKYKARRRTALNRMASIEDDLNRVGDIIAELERRVESLKRQAQKAARYRSLKSEIKARMISGASREIGRLKKKSESAEQGLTAVLSAAEELRGKISALTDSSDMLSLDILGAEKELAEINVRYDSFRNTIAEKEKELARLDSRLEYLEEAISKARETAGNNTSALAGLAESHGRCAEELHTVEERLVEVEIQSGTLREKFREFERKVAERTVAHQNSESEYRRIERELSACGSAADTVRVKRESGEARLTEISRRSSELEKARAEAAEECARLAEERCCYASREREFTGVISELNCALTDKNRAMEALDKQARQARDIQSSLRAERDFLAEVIRTGEGYSGGVKSAMNAENLKGRISGVLADLVSADERYERAVESALLDRLQSIVVDNPDTALEGIGYLSTNLCGRAAFLAIDDAEPEQEIPLPHDSGLLGPAAQFVRVDERYRPVIRRLLRGVYIVDSLETAYWMHTWSREGRFVTLDGDMVGSQGDYHCGGISKDGQSAAIGRREKLEKLTAALEQASGDASDLEKKRAALTEDYEFLHTSLRDKERDLNEVRRELAGITAHESRAAAKKEASSETLAALGKEAAGIEDTFENYDAELVSLEQKAERLQEQFREAGDRVGSSSADISALREELEHHRAGVNECDVERAALTEKKAALSREIHTIVERRETLAQAGCRILHEIEDAENESLQAGMKKSELFAGLESLDTGYTSLRSLKEEKERDYNEFRARRSESERQLQNLRRDQADLGKGESSLTLEREEAALQIKSIIERLSDEYFITARDIPEPVHDPDYDPEQERFLLEDLKRKIQALGDVNMAAEADYQEEKSRLDFLTRERDDLVEARRALHETIQKINNIARERFKETFERIRMNFGKTFADFFEGGVCDLALDENADPLEADILITARPPGKNVRSISLLSSGERALTAISLLFAIYLVKPSPFCILDEVDAPLDDANIDRFLRVIREFSRETQFIMVTHNKKTMAAADNLYGITMAEPGLSTLVSVRLSQIDGEEKEQRGEREFLEEMQNPL
ncbi:MAG: chromosome segregation protein SMC [Candidatus Latescibacter sp.]|nr:chromosome segregation protein SMC [Candidatus Latescibacter sp.]